MKCHIKHDYQWDIVETDRWNKASDDFAYVSVQLGKCTKCGIYKKKKL